MNEYLKKEEYIKTTPSPYKKTLIEITDWKKVEKEICVYFENRPKKSPVDFDKLEKAMIEEGENLAPVLFTPIKDTDKGLYYLDENFNYISWPEDWPRPKLGIPDGTGKYFFNRRYNQPCWGIISEKANRSKIKTLNNSGSSWKLMDFILHNAKLISEYQEGAKALLNKVYGWRSKGFKLGSIINIFSKDTKKIKDKVKENCYKYTEEKENILRIAYSCEPYMSAYSVERFLKALTYIYTKYQNWNPEYFKNGLAMTEREKVDSENWNDANSAYTGRELILKYTDIGHSNKGAIATERRNFNNSQIDIIIEQEKEKENNRCHQCAKVLIGGEARKHINHHPVPYSKGKGQKPTNINNGKICCQKCNQKSGNFMTEKQIEKQIENQQFTFRT